MNRDTYEMLNRLQSAGIAYNDALAIRRCAMTLHRWNELECGLDNGCNVWGAHAARQYARRHGVPHGLLRLARQLRAANKWRM